MRHGNLKMEYPSCLICGSGNHRSIYTLANPYTVVECSECRTLFLSPRLPESTMMAMYREPGYFFGESFGYGDYSSQVNSLHLTFRRLLNQLHRLGATGGRLLDVGCGEGLLLEDADDFFDYCAGTEMCPQVAEMARERANVIWAGGVDQIPPSERFDCICAIQVVEHLYQPVQFVRSLSDRLKPEGRLVLATPDAGGFMRRIMRSHWLSFKPPEHVVFFDYIRLENLMVRCGLTRFQRLRYPHAFPLSLVLKKLGIHWPEEWKDIPIWIPGTTVAIIGWK